MKPETYYSCPFCPRGQFLLEFLYRTDKDENLYKAECDRCKASFSIVIPRKEKK